VSKRGLTSFITNLYYVWQ